MLPQKFQSLFKLIKYILRNYRWQIIILAGLSFVGGIFEGIGVNAFVPLFSLLGGEENSTTGSSFVLWVQKLLQWFHLELNFKTLFIFIFIVFLSRTIVLFWVEYVRIRLIMGYEDQKRQSLFRGYLSSAWPYLLKQKLGHFETLVMTDVQQSGAFLSSITKTITIIASLLVYIVVALNISVSVTLITGAGGVLLFVVFKPLMKKSRTVSNAAAQMKRDGAHLINQTDVGMKALKAMGVEKELSTLAGNFFSTFKMVRTKMRLFKHINVIFTQPLSLAFIGGVFIVFRGSPGYSFASFLVLLYLIQRIFMYVEQLQGNLHEINETYPFFRSVLYSEEKMKEQQEAVTGAEKFSFSREIQFSDISFSYKNGSPVLSDIHFSIQKGECVGIVGPSGSGKTTLVDLLLRLFQPTKGKILLDGVDVQNISLSDWRSHIGYVAQDVFLLNGTLAENIRFYNPAITDAEVMEALTKADLDEFVQAQPKGMHTLVGERGVLLSGGQRQRVAIARALARRPEILILDEATSALDNESETQVQEVIKKLKGKITVIMIAHRLSTIMDCNRLVVVDHGKIQEEGAPDALLNDTQSYFYKVNHI